MPLEMKIESQEIGKSRLSPAAVVGLNSRAERNLNSCSLAMSFPAVKLLVYINTCIFSLNAHANAHSVIMLNRRNKT